MSLARNLSLPASDDELEAVQAHRPIALADWRADEPHPPLAADRRANLGVEREAAPVADCVGPQGLHLGAGFFAIERDRFIAREPGSARHSENVVDAARPDQRIVLKIAFP